MKRFLCLSLAFAALTFSGCANFKTNFNAFLARPETVATITILEEQAKLDAKRIVTSIAVDSVDAKNKQDLLHSIAQGIRENMPSITEGKTTLDKVVVAWSKDKPHWQALAAALGGLYSELPANKRGNASLEALAEGLQSAATAK